MLINTGTDSFTGGMNQAGKDFKSFTLDAGAGDPNGVIGSASDPLRFDCNQTNTGVVTLAGRMLRAAMGAGNGGTWNRLEFYPANGEFQLFLGTISTMNDLWVDGGRLEAGEATVLPASNAVKIFSGDHIIRQHASNVPTIEVYGGRLLLQRDFTTLRIYGDAQVVIDLPAGVTGGNIEMRASPRGRLVHLAGDLGTLDLAGGSYDKSQLYRSSSTGDATYWPGCVEFVTRGVAKVTHANRYERLRGPRRG